MTNPESRAGTRALIIIAVVATLATVYEAHWFFVPVAFGFTLAAVLSPLVGWLRRLRVPSGLAAAVAVLAVVGLLVGVGTALEPPIRSFASEVPKSIERARTKVRSLGGPFARIADIGVQPSPAAQAKPGPSAPGEPPAGTAAAAPPGGTQSMATVQRIFGGASSLMSELVEVTLLAAFLLAAGGAWTEKLAAAVRDPERHRGIIDAADEMRSVVARYFLVTLAINAVQAVVIALGLMLLGYPSPVLWGALTFLLEFIPYLGGLVMVALLLVVGLASGGSLLRGISGPALYLTVTTLQNNLVSPIAYGRGLRLNPTAILVGLILFWGLWGVAGAFLAVPLLAAFQVVAQRVPSLRGVAVFLAD